MPFISPGPAEGGDNVLSDRAFNDTLHSIVEHVFADSNPPRSMTFGIYGEWGMGKSTALREVIHLMAREQAKPEHAKLFSTFVFTEFNAAAWEPFENARLALSYEIIANHPGALSAIELALSDGSPPAVEYAAAPLVQAERLFRKLGDLQSSPIIEHWIQGIVRSKVDEVGKFAQIVLIDDLDRCSHSFTYAVLAATNYWSAIRDIPLYFIVAAHREHLISALNEFRHGVRAEQALEKYIHTGITIPDFLSRPSATAQYIGALLEKGGPQGARLMSLAEDAVANPFNCVIAPLLLFSNSAALTPRSAKDRVNALLAHFNPVPNSSSDTLRRDAKNAILRWYWPEFWDRVLEPLYTNSQGSADTAPLRQALKDLVTFGGMILRDWSEDDTFISGFDFAVQRIGSAIPAWTGANARLAMYLAMEPQWSAPPATLEGGAKGVLSEQGPLRDAASQSRPSLDNSFPAEAGSRSTNALFEAEPNNLQSSQSAEDLLLNYYLDAENAALLGNSIAAREKLLQIANLAAHIDGKRFAPRIGNVALLAERVDENKLALWLHQRAHELDRTHWNIAQNYVDFILDQEDKDLLQEAADILAELQDRGSSWRPERTRILSLRYSAMVHESLSDSDKNSLAVAIEEARSEASVVALLRLMPLHPAYIENDLLLDLGRDIAVRQTEPGELYRVLRLVADALAESSAKSDERAALRIYDFLLASGLPSPDGQREYVVLHNGAALLRSLDYDAAGVEALAEAYRLEPDDQRVRRSLAEALVGISKKPEAQKILHGESLGELALEDVVWPSPADCPEPVWLNRLETVVNEAKTPAAPGAQPPFRLIRSVAAEAGSNG